MHLFIKEKEIEKIVLEHLLRIRKIEEESCHLIKAQIEQLTVRFLLMINQNLKNKDHSKNYECLYYLMLESKERYEAYIARVDSDSHLIEDDLVRDIFIGIKEIAENASSEMVEKEDNPIAYERMVIISGGILRIKQLILNETEGDYGQCNIGNHITKAELIEYLNNHVNEFFKRSLPQVYEVIDDTIQSLAIREAARPYLESMLEQKKMLETLVLVQIDLIEERLKGNEANELANDLIGILQEIYQQTLTVEHKIKLGQEDSVSAEDIIDMRAIEAIIEDHLLSKTSSVTHLLQRVADNRQDSLRDLLNKVTDELDKLTLQTISDIKKASAPYQFLSCQILELFGDAVEQLSKIELVYQSEVGEKIAKGILETMLLKHEVIKEKDTVYQMSKKDVSISEEKKLFDIRSEFEAKAENILNEAIDGSNEGFLTIQERFQKKVDAIKISHINHDMAYLRKDLLFELRSFDEIVKHSVEKLIEYEESSAEALVKVMKYVYDQSRKILNRNGILFLEPDPHERFDGKLHEIMLAEQVEGYAKGEVIKCQNIGYIKDGYVIMRANIVAAR